MTKSERLLLILNLLRSRRNLTASNLAKECEVSERTVYRDIRALSEARVPIYFDRGYKLLTDAFLPPLNFTVDELLTLYLGLSSEPIQSVDSLRRSGKQALAKLESLIPESIRVDYENAKQRIKVQREKQCSRQTGDLIFDLLKQAICSKKQIKLRYDSTRSSEIIQLTPRILIYQNREWHLEGIAQRYRRRFRLGMIKNVTFSESDSFSEQNEACP